MPESPESPSLFAQPLQGVIPPMITPLTDRDTIDETGTERLLNHVIEGGVAGVFILGTTGEAPSLSYRLRRDFIQLASRIVDGRVPIMVGITDTSFVESVNLAHAAKEAGAVAVVLSTPYYFPAGQTELTNYIDHIVEELPLPLMLYNIPSLTKVTFEIDTLRELSKHRKIVGVKDSSGDIDYFCELVTLKKIRPDWTILVGPEHLLAETVQGGGDGGVNGGANIFPKLFTEMFSAAQTGNTDRISVLQSQIDNLQPIYEVGKYASRFIKATKCAASLRGICSDHMAEPFNHFLEPERHKVASIINKVIETP
ncbi:MAG: dihydrodipicolinate synthase family protein [Fuerstiella sp.]|nr:dihydrodipicolinate synthase family protein [Fuerstiella sp.]